MIDKPRLKRYITVFPLSDATWGLRGGNEELWRIKLTEPQAVQALGALLPFLDGSRHRDEILDRLQEREVQRDLAAKLLAKLEASGFLEDAGTADLDSVDAELYREQITYFSRFSSRGGAAVQSRLRKSRVGLVGDPPFRERVLDHLVRAGVGEVVLLDPAGVADELAATGIGGTKFRTARLDHAAIWPQELESELPDIVVLAQAAWAPALLDAIDAFSRERGIAWLLLRATDPQEGWVGPLFIPGETASYRSLEARLKGNLQFFEEHEAFENYLRDGRQTANGAGGLHAFHDVLAAMGVAELIKLLTGIDVPQTAGRFLTVNYVTWETEVHTVLKVPHLEERLNVRPVLYPWKVPPYGETKTRRA